MNVAMQLAKLEKTIEKYRRLLQGWIIRGFPVLTAVSIVFLCFFTIPVTAEEYDIIVPLVTEGSGTPGESMGQSFTANKTGKLSKLRVLSFYSHTNTTVTIYAGSGTGGTVLGTVYGVVTHDATNYTDFSIIDLSSANVSVINGNAYTFYLTTGGHGLYDTGANNYDGGMSYLEGAPFPDYDFIFSLSIASNTAPVFTGGANTGLTVFEDASSTIITTAMLEAKDAEQEAAALTYTLGTAPSQGHLKKNDSNIGSGGTFTQSDIDNNLITFTPSANQNGSSSFTFDVSDGQGGSLTGQTFSIDITPVNDVPSFAKGDDKTVIVSSGAQSFAGWATAISPGPSDESGQSVSFSASNDNNALFSSQPAIAANGTLTFTPADNASGTATVTVYIHDDGGTANGGIDVSTSQTFTITVTVNQAPSFTKGADKTVLEDSGAQSFAGWATAISPGPSSESGQILSFTAANDNNALFSSQPAIAANGTLTFTPADNANGSATVTAYIKDDGGTANGGIDESAPQTFTITVTSLNDAPSFTKGDDKTVLENSGAQSFAEWATAISPGPSDESGQSVSFTSTNDNNGLFLVQPAIAANGTLTFTPAANANGTATVTVRAYDDGGTANGGIDESAPQTFTITVTTVNDAPSFTKGADKTVLEDSGAQTFAVWASAISPGPSDESGQSVSFTTTNDNNALFSSQPAIAANGTLTFTPAANANGTAIVTVRAHDDGGTANGGIDESAPQTFTITVISLNDAPSFTKGADKTVLEDSGAQTFAVWASAISPGPSDESGQIVSFTATNDNNALFSSQPAIAANGTLTFTPAANANGTAIVTVRAHDDGGTANGGIDESAPQTFTITVTAVNDAPSFTKGADKTVLKNSGAQTFAGWATSVSKGPSDESGQTVSFTLSNDNNSLFLVQPAIAANGTLTFTPAANANGSATVTVSIHDDGGTANGGIDASPSQTFTITVTAVNEAPSFIKGTDKTVLEDSGAQTFAGWATAISPGSSDEVGQIVSFTASNDNNSLFSSQPAIAADGTLTFTPAENANGKAIVTVSIHDDGGTANGGIDASAPQTFTITVTEVNDSPIGLPVISGTAVQNQTLTASTAGISDIDGLGTFSYLWQVSNDGISGWSNIVGSPNNTYTLTNNEAAKFVRVHVSYTDGGGTAEELYSDATTKVVGLGIVLTADTTNNDVDHDIEITFVPNAAFESAITEVSYNGNLLNTDQYSITSGKLTLKPSVDGNIYLRTPGTGDVVVTATYYENSSVSQIINAGASHHMLIEQDITGPASNGGSFAQQPTITIRDAYGNTCSSDNTTVITAAKEDAGTWTLTGTTTATASSGVATFTNLGATNTALVNNAQLGFTAAGLTKVTSITVTLPAPAPSGSGGGGNSSTSTQPNQDNIIVIINGEEQNAGKETNTTEDGKSTVTVEVDKKVIESKIDQAGKNNPSRTNNIIQVPIADTKSEAARLKLTGDLVKKLEENNFDISVQWNNIEYIIPAEEFTISEVADNLGVSETDLGTIKVEVKITKLNESVAAKYNEVAKANGAELVFPPVSFEVIVKTSKADGTTGEVEISKFSNYVERFMAIPAEIEPSKITTGVVFNPDGTYSHVPTQVFQKDGKWYAKLNSLTNSNYSVIWNPVTVKSVKSHWSKDAVNDMASRLVIYNAETFAPDKAITRADFAEYIIRALGLYREGSKHENKFTDVSATGDRTLAILIAKEYGIVAGYPDGTFRPDALITREEAMAMYQRAMKITKLMGRDTTRYQNYTDYAAVSSWATFSVKEVLSAHVFNGTATTIISPKSNLTYAEAAQAIKNLLVESNLMNK